MDLNSSILFLLTHHRDSSPEKVSKYFKTKKGQYGSHDQFLGITAPTLQKLQSLIATSTLRN